VTTRQGRDTFHTAICVRCQTFSTWNGTLRDGGRRVKGEGWVCVTCLPPGPVRISVEERGGGRVKTVLAIMRGERGGVGA